MIQPLTITIRELSIGLKRAHIIAVLPAPEPAETNSMMTRIAQVLTFPLGMMLVISGVWIAGGFYYFQSLPTETQMARDRLSEIQETLKTQKQMVDLSLMYEATLVDQETSFDATHRVEKLKQYREMLQPMEKEQ